MAQVERCGGAGLGAGGGQPQHFGSQHVAHHQRGAQTLAIAHQHFETARAGVGHHHRRARFGRAGHRYHRREARGAVEVVLAQAVVGQHGQRMGISHDVGAQVAAVAGGGHAAQGLKCAPIGAALHHKIAAVFFAGRRPHAHHAAALAARGKINQLDGQRPLGLRGNPERRKAGNPGPRHAERAGRGAGPRAGGGQYRVPGTSRVVIYVGRAGLEIRTRVGRAPLQGQGNVGIAGHFFGHKPGFFYVSEIERAPHAGAAGGVVGVGVVGHPHAVGVFGQQAGLAQRGGSVRGGRRAQRKQHRRAVAGHGAAQAARAVGYKQCAGAGGAG